eukprot:GSChrysophyteH1.ASY1.ANO1.3125.1 assembled CDS
MDSSISRRQHMEKQLFSMGYDYERFRGITLNNIHIPEDIRMTWNTKRARYQSEELDYRSLIHDSETEYSPAIVVTGLYGRRKTNRLNELGCTISHLLAMRKAIYSDLKEDGSHSDSNYAIITEDDVVFPFSVDWKGLIESAPAGFGILQLFNSNEESMQSLFKNYQKSSAKAGSDYRNPEKLKLWHERFPRQPGSFWSTCAYVFDKRVMRPVIDSIIHLKEISSTNFGKARILAGIKWECVPKSSPCCPHPENSTYSEMNPCVQSPRGFQADMYLYATTKSYVMTLPIIANGQGGNQSTLHQAHVENIHYLAFQRQRGYINDLIMQNTALPQFIEPACGYKNKGSLLPVGGDQMMVLNRKTHLCTYQSYTSKEIEKRPTVFWIKHQNQEARDSQLEGESHRMDAHLKQLGLHSHEVPAVKFSELQLSKEVQSAMAEGKDDCGQLMENQILHRTSRLNVTADVGHQYFLRSICGVFIRGRSIPFVEIEVARTISHLVALYEAANSSNSTSKIALVAEEDTQILFNIDWDKLVFSVNEKRSNRDLDWAILYLNNPTDHLAKNLWWKRMHNESRWGSWAGADTPANLATSLLKKDAYFDVVSDNFKYTKGVINTIQSSQIGQAYVINKAALKMLLSSIVTRVPLNENSSRFHYTIDLLASPEEAPLTQPQHYAGMRYSPDGINLASVLISLAPKRQYILHYPLVNSDLSYKNATKRDYMLAKVRRTYINNLIEGVGRLPKFISAACGTLLDLVPPKHI